MNGEKFLLVDDNTLLRASLAKLIGLWREGAVIEEASDGHEALEKARRLHPDVILMDVRMPGCQSTAGRMGGI
jgi:two-component system invasion response regulator UvrY